MAWVNTGASADLYDGARTYGTIYLQYDSDSTGTNRACRLWWDFTTGTSLSVTLRDITLAGGVIGNADVGTSDTVIWSGVLTGGQSYTFSWYCNWYSYGRMDYTSSSGTVPSAATAPSGGDVAFVSAVWDSITATSSVTSWGTGYTSDTTELVATVIDPTATQSDWGTKGRQVVITQVPSSTTSGNATITTSGSTPRSGGWPIKGCTDFKLLGGGQTSVGNSFTLSSQSYATPPAPSVITVSDDGGRSDITFTVDFTGVAADNSTSYDQNSLTRTVRYKRSGDSSWTYVDNDTAGLITDTTTFNLVLSPKEEADIEGWQAYKGNQSEVTATHIANTNRAVHFYGGVRELDPQTGTWSNPEAKEVVKLYGSVNGERKKIIKLYGSVNGVAKQVYEDDN